NNHSLYRVPLSLSIWRASCYTLLPYTTLFRSTLAEQHLLEKNKISWKDELREAIEYARDNSTNFDSFKRHLNDVYGVETKLRGKTLSFKHPERERFIRANKLGA